MNSTIKTEPTIFVVFGGTGDLTSRKIAPALYNLFLDSGMLSLFFLFNISLKLFCEYEVLICDLDLDYLESSIDYLSFSLELPFSRGAFLK